MKSEAARRPFCKTITTSLKAEVKKELKKEASTPKLENIKKKKSVEGQWKL
jgi:hypothetical protein